MYINIFVVFIQYFNLWIVENGCGQDVLDFDCGFWNDEYSTYHKAGDNVYG